MIAERKINMKKSRLARIVCLIVAGALLTGAITVAAVIGSPYETLKNAIFDSLLATNNMTFEGEFTLIVDGEVVERDITRTIRNGDAEASWDYVNGEMVNLRLWSDRMSINPLRGGGRWNDGWNDDGPQWYTANIRPETWGSRSNFPAMLGFGLTADDRGTARFRLVELAIDLVVGDLQHNLSMTMNDGVRRVSGEFTEHQLPEILRVMRDVAVEESLRWRNTDNLRVEDYPDPIDAPWQNFSINRMGGVADVDNNGNLTFMDVGGSAIITDIFGRTVVPEVSAVMRMTDFGTSDPTAVFGDAVEFLLSEFGDLDRNITVHFTRNPDGTINRDSVTDRWPFDEEIDIPQGNLSRTGSREITDDIWELWDELMTSYELELMLREILDLPDSVDMLELFDLLVYSEDVRRIAADAIGVRLDEQ